jgi:hypothetical protein
MADRGPSAGARPGHAVRNRGDIQNRPGEGEGEGEGEVTAPSLSLVDGGAILVGSRLMCSSRSEREREREPFTSVGHEPRR